MMLLFDIFLETLSDFFFKEGILREDANMYFYDVFAHHDDKMVGQARDSHLATIARS